MVECKRCGGFNLPDTKYCQKCGQHLENRKKKGFLKSASWKNVAGMGSKGISIAPLFLTLMENKDVFTESRMKKKRTSIVIPLENGSWYCPDCGHHNRKYSFTCTDCGKSI